MLRRVVAYGLVVVIVGGGLLLGGGYLLLSSKPAGYTHPSDFTREYLQNQAFQFSPIAVNKINNALGDPSGATPLDVTFTEAMINSFIRTLSPETQKKLPPWLTNPQVVFTEDEVVLMGDVDYRDTKAVLSLHIAPRLTEDGNLELVLTKARAGRLPVPAALTSAILDKIDSHVARLKERIRTKKATATTATATSTAASAVPAALEQLPPVVQQEFRKNSNVNADEIELEALQRSRDLLSGQTVRIDLARWHLRLEALDQTPHCLHVTGKRFNTLKTSDRP